MTHEKNIIDVIGAHVELSLKGREHVGLCPFHDDHRPSMLVNEEKQIFKCFACGAGGGARKFLMMFHGPEYQPENWKPMPRRCPIAPAKPSFDMKALFLSYRQAISDARLTWFAQKLSVEPQNLNDLRVGWDEKMGSYTFPMRNAVGEIIGIRRYGPDGRKWAVKGSKQGLFIPSKETHWWQKAYVTEGPSDTAAMLSINLLSVGRPSCMGGADLVVQFCRIINVKEVIVVADADTPGINGATALANRLVSAGRMVKILIPPKHKDVREWIKAGATAAVIECVLRNTDWFVRKPKGDAA